MNFDRVAAIYDQTRGLPEGIPEQIADRIAAISWATPDTRFLELGVGTGRIALPLIQRGYTYTGVDISDAMMDQLRGKLPPNTTNLTLLNADVTDLPLPDRSMNVVLTVRLLHLVPEWKRALDEVRRVLAPGGWYLLGYNGTDPSDPDAMIRHTWAEFAREAGAPLRPENGSTAAVEAELTERGCRMAVYQVSYWKRQIRPVELLEALRDRAYSHVWNVPDETLRQVYERIVPWAEREYADLSRPITVEQNFQVMAARFPE